MSTGSSVGSVVWPILLANLPDKVGFGWTCRIMALLCGICGVISYLLLATRLPRKPRGPIFYKPAWRNPQYVLAVLNFWVSTSRPCPSFGCFADILRPPLLASSASRRILCVSRSFLPPRERNKTDRTGNIWSIGWSGLFRSISTVSISRHVDTPSLIPQGDSEWLLHPWSACSRM